MLSVLQPWVMERPLMQQSVMLLAMRGPDALPKDHPAKPILKWYRRCLLVNSFDHIVRQTPNEPGGGNFTGPIEHPDPTAQQMIHLQVVAGSATSLDASRAILDAVFVEYMRSVDSVPIHFHLHLMHGVQILGYHHPKEWIRWSWCKFYNMLVNGMHLFPEPQEEMDRRLSDDEDSWRERMAYPEE